MTSPSLQNLATEQRQPRRKMLVRDDRNDLPGIRLTLRDIAIILAVYVCRALTTDQIRERFFAGSRVACQQRLKLLFHHEYLHRDEQPTKLHEGRQPLIYFLDKRGAEVLADYMGIETEELDWRPRDNVSGAGNQFLAHLLKTNDVRLAIEQAVDNTDYSVLQWLDERELRRRQRTTQVTVKLSTGRTQKVAVVPDGYFALQTNRGIDHYFIEIDLRTTIGMSSSSGRRDWVRRVKAYEAFHSSGLFKSRYQAEHFRVLTVTTGPRRLANLEEITEKAGLRMLAPDVRGENRFWYTTFDELNSETVLASPIWQVAGHDEQGVSLT